MVKKLTTSSGVINTSGMALPHEQDQEYGGLIPLKVDEGRKKNLVLGSYFSAGSVLESFEVSAGKKGELISRSRPNARFRSYKAWAPKEGKPITVEDEEQFRNSTAPDAAYAYAQTDFPAIRSPSE